jgi:ribosomal protein S18 acetylase RimI-like enzyme
MPDQSAEKPSIAIRPGRPGDLAALAAIHMQAYENLPSFTRDLGLAFVRRTYRHFLHHPAAFALVAEAAGVPAGFLVGWTGPKPRAFTAGRALPAALALLTRPAAWRRLRLTRTARWPAAPREAMTLYSLAVANGWRGARVGDLLLLDAERPARERGLTAIRTSVGRANLASLFLHRSLGYRRVEGAEIAAELLFEKPLEK